MVFDTLLKSRKFFDFIALNLHFDEDDDYEDMHENGFGKGKIGAALFNPGRQVERFRGFCLEEVQEFAIEQEWLEDEFKMPYQVCYG